MSATTSSTPIGGAANLSSQGFTQTGQSSTSSTSSIPPFIRIGECIQDKGEIGNRQKWLREMIEKAATLITSSPEKKNLADEGLVKYALKKEIVEAEINALENALSHVQPASPSVTSKSSVSVASKKITSYTPSDLIKNYMEAIRAVKHERDRRNEAVSKHGDKEAKILDEIRTGRAAIDAALVQVNKCEKLVLTSFEKNDAEGTESHLEFLKKAIDNKIDLGLIKYSEKDIRFTRELVRAQDQKSREKIKSKLAEINLEREKALEALEQEIKDDIEQLLAFYLLSLRNYYETQSIEIIREKIGSFQNLFSFLNEQVSSKERSKEIHASYMANARDLYNSLDKLVKPLDNGKLFAVRFSLSSLGRSADQIKKLIADLRNENKAPSKADQEHSRNIASRLQYEYLQARTRFDEIKFSKEPNKSDNNNDNDADAEVSEDYAKLRSGYAEILITKDEKKILENYQS